MTKPPQILFFSIVLMLFISCKTTTYVDSRSPLSAENLQKITIEIQVNATKSFTITEKQEMIAFIQDMNASKVNGAWKGAFWDKIVLEYVDGEKVFSTNGKVFGQGSSGTFYNLNDKYKRYWTK